MTESVRLPFVDEDPEQPGVSLMPILPLTLSNRGHQVVVPGLLDTGSAVNVLPFAVGQERGLNWDQRRTAIVLTGNLARIPARGVIVEATVASFGPVRLAFAWAQTDSVRPILGQANFFHEFDVCFFRSRAEFEIGLKETDAIIPPILPSLGPGG